MRRTRHVVLPVRSWLYIGLLIVSLACLTLGLVSRDREGHSGNLAGPELEHQAPHEVDACPNLNPFTKMPSHEITKPREMAKSINTHEMEGSRIPSTSRRFAFSRSLSLDRSSRILGEREARERSFRNRDLRAIERLSRTRATDESGPRESRFRTIAQSRDARNTNDLTARLSRSRDLSNRANDRRSAERRSLNVNRANYRSADRRSTAKLREIDETPGQINRVDRSMERRDSADLQRRIATRDRRSLSLERRVPSETSRRESRQILANHRELRDSARRVDDRRLETRERKSRLVEQHESNAIERRATERRDANRASRESFQQDRSGRNVVRRDTDRRFLNINPDRRNRERSLETRRVLPLDRVANRERASRFSVSGDSRKDHVRSDERRSLFRTTERSNSVDDLARETLGRQARSVRLNDERSGDYRSFERRASARRSTERREMDHAERRGAENRLRLDRATSRVASADLRQEKNVVRSRRAVNDRDTAIRENSRAVRSRYDLEESRERRERLVRAASRSLDRNSWDRRELARRIRETTDHDRRSRDLSRNRESVVERRERTLERQERIDRSHRSREEARIVLQKSRDSRKDLERRERTLELPERTDRSHRSRVEARIVLERSRNPRKDLERRVSERNLERRASREKILERSHAGLSSRRVVATPDSTRLDSRRSSERSIADRRSHEVTGMVERRVVQPDTESRVSRERTPERRFAPESRSSPVQRIASKSREATRRTQDDRLKARNLENSMSARIATERRTSMHRDELIRRSSETRLDARREFTGERRVARTAGNRLTESLVSESRRGSSNPNVENPAGLASLRRLAGHSRVTAQNREQRGLSADKILFRAANDKRQRRLPAKWDGNLQERRVERSAEVRAKIVSDSIASYEFLKRPTTYELVRQAVVAALCTVYGLSLYNGKKSLIRSNVMQQVQRFLV